MMKMQAEETKTSNVKAIGVKSDSQVVKPKDRIGGMLIVGLGPGPRRAA